MSSQEEKSEKLQLSVEDRMQRIKAIRARIAELDLVCSGSILERMKVCGKPNCRCAKTPPVLHGPYFEWSWPEEGHLAHKIVSREQADVIRRSIDNYREIKNLIDQWKAETKAIVEMMNIRKP
jgi:hypothetical protein